MAPRAILLAFLLLAAVVPATGCIDRLQGVGTFRVVLQMTEESSFTFRNSTVFRNELDKFQRAPAFVGSVVVKRADTEPIVKSATNVGPFDLVALQGGDAVLMDQKVAEGKIASVSVLIPPFNATLAEGGRVVRVNTSIVSTPPAPYDFPKNATVDLAGSTTFRVVFMLTKAATTREEYILVARLVPSGPR